jgi:hypothetical protein
VILLVGIFLRLQIIKNKSSGGFMKKLFFYILFFMLSLSLFAQEKYDWLINYNWILDSEYIMPTNYYVIFRKLEVVPESVMFQRRLRKERFSIGYQTDKQDKFFILKDTFYEGVYNIIFGNNYTTLSLIRGTTNHGLQNRVGVQENKNYPLVGIWGRLPYLTEYRLIDPKDCFIFMEIKEQYPFWAIREGTYLLKQIDEKIFETVSSFPDGRLRLEIRNETRIILTPLFTLPDDEQGRLDPLLILRH